MLSDKPVRRYIEEQADVFAKAIDEHIYYELQSELVADLKDNAYIFSGFKTYHALSEVGLSMQDEDGNVKSWSQFRNDVKAIDKKYNERWLKTEYNYALNQALMAGQWATFSDNTDLYALQYRTVGDNSVRDSHKVLNGITLTKDDPFWIKYYTPNGWGCRCAIVQVLIKDHPLSNSKKATAIAEEEVKELFKFNSAKERRLFPDKHPYFGKKGIKHCDSTLNLAYGNDDPCKVLSEVVKAKELRDYQQKAKENSRLVRQSINQHKGVRFESKEFVSGGLTMLRRSLKDISEHAHEDVITQKWLSEYKAGDTFNAKYIGYKECITDKNGVRKHPEAEYFTYYETELYGEKRYLNVKIHRHHNMDEVLYTIETQEPLNPIKKKKG
ncbi:MAG: hypothetical protein CSB01_01415 [Bacteroidia bacterium]|nr:MAG: hypothetical protein CSB01_01415 [Bacteroidia bacterium]